MPPVNNDHYVAQYVAQFDPIRDEHGWVNEGPGAYAARMRMSLLPEWPEEVLIEWLHKHAGHVAKYAFLRFERFAFERQTWPLVRIPGAEAFSDPKFCEDFSNVEERAAQPYDWLAKYMVGNGTWNTPVVLLDSEELPPTFAEGKRLRRPIHLLEGHRRLSFLNGLRATGKVLQEHNIWLVRLRAASNET